MDESGGSGQPRSGTDESTDRRADRMTPATDPTRPDPAPTAEQPADAQPADTDRDDAVREATQPPLRAENSSQDETPRHPRGADAPSDTGGEADSENGDSETSGNGATQQGPADTPHDPTAPASPPPPAQAAPLAPRARRRPTTPVGHDVRPLRDANGARTRPRTLTQTPTRPADFRRAPDAERAPPPAHPPPSQDTTRPPQPTPGTPERHLAHSGAGKTRPPQRPREPRGGLLMGRPFGVPVYVAPSWFLVAALITWVFGGQLDRVLPELGAARYLVSLFFAVAFYASVLVHELAHTVAALRFKLPVRRIQLQFFGGVSEIEKEAETPGREFVLAFVGPLLSLVLAGVFYAAMQTVEPGTVPGVLLAGLMVSNLIVAAFNLLPGLPLDGGRMLRAVVWKITGRPMSGTIAAAWIGRALAVSVLVGLPLLTQSGALGADAVDNVGMDTVMDALLAAILAAIIWTGAGNSLRMARLREHLPELRARTLTRRAVPVETDTPLSEALRRANAAGARALVVVDADGNPLSLVREAAIVGVPEHRRPWVAVSGLAQDLTDGMRVSAELAGEELLDALRAAPATEYLVVEETGEIYGVLSAADVERAFVKAMARPS
ncbi:site-2 protease family protein [Streptomyces sp. R28]|uniref:Site-2 protease family protein n=1 Tax=Streptomyces sp. R28 TaxID=3238628 RepID=A0AB39PT48_9ACTN